MNPTCWIWRIDFFLIDKDLAGRRQIQTGPHIEQGAFAATAGPDDGNHLTIGNTQIDIFNRTDNAFRTIDAIVAGELLGDIAIFDPYVFAVGHD